MNYWLLLADDHAAAMASQLRLTQLGESAPGGDGVAITFRPLRSDALFLAAKAAGEIAYRIVRGEGWLRSQLVVEFATERAAPNVLGRSSELLFAIAIVTSVLRTIDPSWTFGEIAATGTLSDEGIVGNVRHLREKLIVAIDRMTCEGNGVAFFPRATSTEIDSDVVALALAKRIALIPVDTLDEALDHFGIALSKTYLRAPFRGLEHFGFEHRAIFFGRGLEVTAMVEKLLRREALQSPGVLIVGPSGAGKSSFLRAGVLPALIEPGFIAVDAIRQRPAPRSSRGAIWRPSLAGPNPTSDSITRSISAAWSPALGLVDDVATTSPATLTDISQRCRTLTSDRRRVCCIDQFEELFAGGYSDEAIAQLGEFLRELQATGVWLLATIRDDFVSRLDTIPALAALFNRTDGRFFLGPVNGSALVDVIVRPAVVAGLRYELDQNGISLSHVLQDAAVGEAEPLPLLEFTLLELYQRRAGSILCYRAYRDIGGLRGSVASRANEVAENLTAEERQALLRGLGRLFAVPTDEAVRQRDTFVRARARLEEFSEVEQKQLERFVAARLLVKSSDPDGTNTVVELAHEALVDCWPPLQEWTTENRQLLAWRSRVLLPLMRIWVASERQSVGVLPRSLLRNSRTVRANHPGVLTEAESEFLRYSHAWHRKRTIAIASGIVGVGAATLLAAITPWRNDSQPPPAFSIAVLPFDGETASSLDRQPAEWVSKAIASRLKDSAHYLTIPAWESVATFNGPKNVRAVGRQLNVRYLLEGSVGTDDGSAAVELRLIDAPSATEIWSDRVHLPVGPGGDDKALTAFVFRLRGMIGSAEQRRNAGPLPANATALDMVAHAGALQALERDQIRSAIEARRFYDKALEIDPNLVLALVGKGYSLQKEIEQNPRADRDRLVEELEVVSSRLISLDDKDPRVWSTRVDALLREYRWDAALLAIQKTEALGADPAEVLGMRARLSIYLGRPAEALSYLDQAAANDVSSSRWDAWLLFLRCSSQVALGDYRGAISSCQKSIAAGDWWMAHCYLVAAYAEVGNMQMAASERASLEAFFPGFRIDDFAATRLSNEPRYMEQIESHLYSGLRKAGVREVH